MKYSNNFVQIRRNPYRLDNFILRDKIHNVKKSEKNLTFY